MKDDMEKLAQLSQGLAGRTLQDLYLAVMMDTGLSYMERQQVIKELDQIMGSAPPSTPLQSLMWKLGGAGIGFLVAKYFNLGPMGQGVLAATGVGLGTLVNKRLTDNKVSYLHNVMQM